MIEDGDSFADGHDEFHVVFDEQDADAERSRMKRISSMSSIFSCGIHAGGGLVEEQDLGLRGQSAGDFQAALVAVGKVLGDEVGLGIEVERVRADPCASSPRAICAGESRRSEDRR